VYAKKQVTDGTMGLIVHMIMIVKMMHVEKLQMILKNDVVNTINLFHTHMEQYVWINRVIP
jgi:hypothetical protein